MNKESLLHVMNILGMKVHAFNGNWASTICPFASVTHSKGYDSKPSFGISFYDNKVSGYNCFSCHQKGTLSRLPSDLYSSKVTDDLIESAKLSKMIRDLEGHNASSLIITCKDVLPTNDEVFDSEFTISKNPFPDPFKSKLASNYLLSRNITKNVSDYLDLGYSHKELRIVFPIKNSEGTIKGFTSRLCISTEQGQVLAHTLSEMSFLKKIVNTKGLSKEVCVLGIEHVEPNSKIVVVEGLFGYASLQALKLKHNLAISPVATLGSSVSVDQAKLISSKSSQVCLMFDPDSAGLLGTEKATKLFINEIGIYPRVFDWNRATTADVDYVSIDDLERGGVLKREASSNIHARVLF